MSKLATLQTQVAQWSKDNFGKQISKLTQIELHSLAPLLGIFEEVGELDEAVSKNCDNGVKDALADIVIYLCDFTSRFGIVFEDYYPRQIEKGSLISIAGNLAHHVLKTHQGIRGYEDIDYAVDEITQTCYELLDMLQKLCDTLDIQESPIELAEKTFAEIVSKRNWVANPQDAHKA